MGASRRTRRSHRGLVDELYDAAALAGDPEACAVRRDEVSHWSVRQHLDHLLKVGEQLHEAFEEIVAGEAPSEPGGAPSPRGRLVLLTGWIPRGRARSPELVLPSEREPAEIEAGFRTTGEALERLGPSLDQLETFPGTRPHPILGHFTASQWMRFGHVHHRHHVKIVRDILAGTSL